MKKLGIVIWLPHPLPSQESFVTDLDTIQGIPPSKDATPPWLCQLSRTAPLTLRRLGQTRIAWFAEIHRVGVHRVRNRLLESGLLLVIDRYVHYGYARVGSLEISTVGDRNYRDIVEYCEIVDGSWIVV